MGVRALIKPELFIKSFFIILLKNIREYVIMTLSIFIEQGIFKMDVWEKMYTAARKVQNARTISPTIEVGSVSAAILTNNGNIYVGVCIDTACSLGMCAERNAIANMLTNGESEIDKVLAITPDGKVGSPCGACREFLMQLSKDSGNIEILTDYESRKTVRLKELLPDWWC